MSDTARLLEAEFLMAAGKLHDARKICLALVTQKGESAQAWRLLGQINGNLAQYDDAAACFQKAIAITPHDVMGHIFLGMSLLGGGRTSQAISVLRHATELDPGRAAAHARLGDALQREACFAEAQASYEAALKLNPDNALIHCNLGLALVRQGLQVRGVEHLRRAAQLDPRNPEIQVNLGEALMERRQDIEAETALRSAISLDPGKANSHRALGSLLTLTGRYSDAIASFRTAIQHQPDFTDAMTELAGAMLNLGMVDESVAMYRRAYGTDPHQAYAHGSLLLPLHYLPSSTPQQLLSEQQTWAVQHIRAVGDPVLRGSGMGDGRLRIGYFSPDFRMHSVAYFLDALVSHHNTDQFEIVMYSGVKRPDLLTERFKSLAALWRDVARMPDEQFRDTARNDNLDLLVDLAGHSGGSRLKVIGERLAPVQVSYLGYPGTTGLRTMDYRLTDYWADPQGSDTWYTEKLVRLPGGFLCYSPIFAAPSPGPQPVASNGFITFGSFNNIAKLSAQVISLWARILRANPRSRLLLKAPALGDPAGRNLIETRFSMHGITRDQLVLNGWAPSAREHLAQYANVDIALDTFPYNGTTTTCEALWMGVPVVTIAGMAHAGRVGVSLLSSTGLSDLVATNEDDYIAIATRLANDREKLAVLRNGLRSRMQASPLCDAKRIVREIENAYQSMFAQ